jgi:hypothetical protein
VLRIWPQAVAVTLLAVLGGGSPALVVCALICDPAARSVEDSRDSHRSTSTAECHLADAATAASMSAAPVHPCGDHDGALESTALLSRSRTDTPAPSAIWIASLAPGAGGSPTVSARLVASSPPVSPPRPLGASLVLRI